VNDIIPAKIHKSIGKIRHSFGDAILENGVEAPAGGLKEAYNLALIHFRRALDLHANIGVKKDIEVVERAFSKLQESSRDVEGGRGTESVE
jgi:hypothetical protein